MNVWLAALAGLVVATALGLVNGVLVGAARPALARGDARNARRLPRARVRDPRRREHQRASRPGSRTIGGGYISNELPDALLVLLGFALVLGVLLHATRFGRYVYAIGSNREAARFSGDPVARVRVTVFALSGLMAGFAGIVYLGLLRLGPGRCGRRLGAASTSSPPSCSAASTSSEGRARSSASCSRWSSIAVLRNGMQLANLGGATQDMVIGGLLLAAILVGNVMRGVQGRGLPWTRPRPARKEVTQAETPEFQSTRTSKARQGG